MPALTLQTTQLEDALLPRMDASEVADRIKAMRQQEETVYKCKDYLEVNEIMLHTARKAVDEDCRVKMCQWSFQVVDFCRFRRETVCVAMQYLDRFVSTPEASIVLMDRKVFQLAAMTTLYLSIKLHGPLEMETSLLADLSRGCYTELEIAEMECKILKGLKWRLQGPTPLSFIQHFLALLPTQQVHPAVATAIFDYARFQSELAVSDYQFVTLPQSHIALACILNALDGIDTSLLPLKSQGKFLRAIETFSGILMEDVAHVQDKLNNILMDVYSQEAGEFSESNVSRPASSSELAQQLAGEDGDGRRRSNTHAGVGEHTSVAGSRGSRASSKSSKSPVSVATT